VKKKLKWLFVAALVVFVLMQCVQPAHTNPPVKSDFIAATAPPPPIAAIFRTACYDCHSYETRWPWYSHVAPVSWDLVRDVNYGRDNLNLSEWPTNEPARMIKKLGTMADDIESGDMPLSKYTLIHRDARLTPAQRKDLEDWLNATAERLQPPAAAN